MSKIMIFLLSFTEEIQENYQIIQQLCEIAIAEATQQKGRCGSILDCISDIWDCVDVGSGGRLQWLPL